MPDSLSRARYVLVVEDNEDLARVLADAFAESGFRSDVALTGARALRMAKEDPPDLVLLDLGLPDVDGMSVCREIVAMRGPLVVVITAKDDVGTAAAALQLGAEDYVRKPFGLPELQARVQCVLRRGSGESSAVLRAGRLAIDRDRCVVEVDGRPVELSATELRLLTFLAQHPGWVFSKERLLEALWRGDRDPHAVQVQISSLRHKLEPDPANPVLLVTVKGLGYKLEPG